MTNVFLKIVLFILAWQTAHSLPVSLDTSLESCSHPLGMSNYGIDDSQISASSETAIDTERYGKHSGRLHGMFSWRARENPTKEEYLQVDLGQTKVVTAIATQGDNNATAWVTKFKVKSSNDGKTWKVVESFTGNIDENSVVKHIIDKPFHARHVRVIAEAWFVRLATKIELYGCYPTCDNQPVGLENGLIGDAQITASSTMSSGTKASNGGLRFTGDDSWCAAMDDNNAHLQVDLGVPHVLCAVATQGNSKADQMVTSYTLQTSLDGKKWTEYKENGQIKTFTGNVASNFTAKHNFQDFLIRRYVRVLPKVFIGAPCLRVEFYGVERTTCDKTGSILAKPSDTVPNYRFTATQSLSLTYAPWEARLLGYNAWEPFYKDRYDYLQIDLGHPYILCAISMQDTGQAYRIDERVVTYHMNISMDGTTWTSYPKDVTELPGNNISGMYYPTVNFSKNIFADHEVQVAKFVRIIPMKFVGHKAVRMEFYGVKQAWRQPLGIEKVNNHSKIVDLQMTALTFLDNDHIASAGRLYNEHTWCAKGKGLSYLQVDMLVVKQLTGIAIQGDKNEMNWITKYTVDYGYLEHDLDTSQMISVNFNEIKKDFKIIQVHWLPNPVYARYVRVVPQSWINMVNGTACLSIELYVNQKAPPTNIINSEVVGTLTASPDSFITVKCIAFGDNDVNIKWLLGGRDVTDKSRGKTHADWQAASELQVNFTSASYVVSNFNCEEVENSKFKCITKVTCQAVRANANGDRKDHAIEILVSKDALSTAVVTSPTWVLAVALVVGMLEMYNPHVLH